jgi:hypothetical protein
MNSFSGMQFQQGTAVPTTHCESRMRWYDLDFTGPTVGRIDASFLDFLKQ